MGWSGGSEVAEGLIRVIRKNVKDTKIRSIIYSEVLRVLEGADWDTEEDVFGMDIVWDEMIKQRYPERFETYD